MATGKRTPIFERGDLVSSVAISPDDRWALSGSQTLRLWDLATAKCLRTLEGHTGPVSSVAITPDGRWAVSGGNDNTLRVWELATGLCLRTFEGHVTKVNSIAISADGRWVVSGSEDRTLRLWALDWEYEFPGWADWDEGARPWLSTYLILHTPPVGQLQVEVAPSEEQVKLAMTRAGKPQWTADDFAGLLQTLGHAGYGWLRPEDVRRELEKMVVEWWNPPPFPWKQQQ